MATLPARVADTLALAFGTSFRRRNAPTAINMNTMNRSSSARSAKFSATAVVTRRVRRRNSTPIPKPVMPCKSMVSHDAVTFLPNPGNPTSTAATGNTANAAAINTSDSIAIPAVDRIKRAIIVCPTVTTPTANARSSDAEALNNASSCPPGH